MTSREQRRDEGSTNEVCEAFTAPSSSAISTSEQHSVTEPVGTGDEQKHYARNADGSRRSTMTLNTAHVQQGTVLFRYLGKQTIQDLLRYEKRTGRRFNRMPNDAFIASLGDDELLKVNWAFIHNGVEMRCCAIRRDGTEVFVDMPLATYHKLPRRS